MSGFKLVRAEGRGRHADVLFLAARIGKAQIDELHVFVFDQLKYVFWSHFSSFESRWVSYGVQTKKAFSSRSKLKTFIVSRLPARRCTGNTRLYRKSHVFVHLEAHAGLKRATK